jgi:Zn-dependent membrane protease YugP
MFSSILVVCSIVVVIYFSLYLLFGRKETSINIRYILSDLIPTYNLKIRIKISKKTKPFYDCELKEIVIPPRSRINDIAAGFHEFGHAIDDEKQKGNSFYSTWIQYIFQFGTIIALIMYCIQWLFIQSYILSIISLIFGLLGVYYFAMSLKDEIVASKYALNAIKEHNIFEGNIFRNIMICLFNAMLTYIALLSVPVITVIYQILFMLH